MAEQEVTKETELQELAKGFPPEIQVPLLSGSFDSPVATYDPEFVAFIKQVRENPSQFTKEIIQSSINNISEGKLYRDVDEPFSYQEWRQQNYPDMSLEEVQQELFRGQQSPYVGNQALAYYKDKVLPEYATAARDYMAAPRTRARRSAELSTEFEPGTEQISYDTFFTTADSLREIWRDPSDPTTFNNIPAMAEYVAVQEKKYNEWAQTPAGSAFLKANPDLPTEFVEFEVDLEDVGLDLPGLRNQQYSFSDAINIILRPDVIQKTHIRRLNEALFAAGYYNAEFRPLDMDDRHDAALTEAWKQLITESRLRFLQPDQLLVNGMKARISELDRKREAFDDTTLATRMDELALNFIGRTLSSSEFEDIKNQMKLFATDSKELVSDPERDPLTQLINFESGATIENADIEIEKLLRDQFEPEYRNTGLFRRSRAVHDNLYNLLTNNATQRANLPIPDVLNEGTES